METQAQAQGLHTLIARHWIAGQWHPARAILARRNPANRQDIVTLSPVGGRNEVREACEVARVAQGEWGRTPAPQRAHVIGKLGRLLLQEKEMLSRFVAREMGKPLREARGSVQEAIDTAEFFQSEGRRLYGQTVPSELNGKELFTYRRPIGVVGVITAGNFPIAVPSWKLIPALLCGNTVVWKPSEDAPGVATLFTELWRRAGLPSGALNVVHGGGAEGAGQWLVEEVDAGRVDKISFTGSTVIGRQIGEICGRNLQIPSLELGGKNPLVVLADADLSLAVDGAIWAAFGTAGQRCTSAGNLILDRRIYKEFKEQFLRRAQGMVLGDPQNEAVDYGPMINERFLEGWIAQRAIGLEDGAKLVLDGRRVTAGNEPDNFLGDASGGLYAMPRVFDEVTPQMRVFEEECFGPTINLVQVEGLKEAIQVANAVPYGLSSAIYTRDARAMLHFKEEIKAGMTSINNSTTGAEAHLPFGGNGWSGNGTRESGIWVLDAYLRWQCVNVDLAGKLQKAQIDVSEEAFLDVPHWDKEKFC